jgi:hypothetical protein
MSFGGGRMSHRRHRLVRGRPSRINALIGTAREINKQKEEETARNERKKEPTFGSVKELFNNTKKRR